MKDPIKFTDIESQVITIFFGVILITMTIFLNSTAGLLWASIFAVVGMLGICLRAWRRSVSASKTANTTIKTEIPAESFKDLDYGQLKIQSQRWVDRHHETKIEKVILYRQASLFQKYLKGNVPSKYFVVFETPENTNTDELESDTEHYQTVKKVYRGLMCADFNEVYKNPPPGENFKYEWNFFVKKPSEVLPSDVMIDEPFWILYP